MIGLARNGLETVLVMGPLRSISSSEDMSVSRLSEALVGVVLRGCMLGLVSGGVVSGGVMSGVGTVPAIVSCCEWV